MKEIETLEPTIDGLNECEICGESLRTKYKWSISITNGGRGDFFKRKACAKCIQKITKAPMKRIKFFETIVNYARKNYLSKSSSEDWSYSHIEALKKILNDKKIPIIDYGIPIYEIYPSERYNGKFEYEKVYLHNLIKKRSDLMAENRKLNLIEAVKEMRLGAVVLASDGNKYRLSSNSLQYYDTDEYKWLDDSDELNSLIDLTFKKLKIKTKK